MWRTSCRPATILGAPSWGQAGPLCVRAAPWGRQDPVRLREGGVPDTPRAEGARPDPEGSPSRRGQPWGPSHWRASAAPGHAGHLPPGSQCPHPWLTTPTPTMALPYRTWGSHPALAKLQGQDQPPNPHSGATRWNFCPSVWRVRPVFRLGLEARASSQRGLYSSLRSHGTCLRVWAYLGPFPFFLSYFSPLRWKHMLTLTFL